jgi:hypothetical protein
LSFNVRFVKSGQTITGQNPPLSAVPKSGHSADGLGPNGFKVTKFNSRHRLGAHSVRAVLVCQRAGQPLAT